jgi:hypothetical protein
MTIEQMLNEDVDFILGCETLFQAKPEKKLFLKGAEEAGELSVAIIQSRTKPSSKDRMKILEELVDAQQHITLLQRFFTDEEKKAMVDEKTKKMISSDDYKKWEKIYKEKN